GYRSAFVTTGILQGLVIAVVAQVLRHPPHEGGAVAAKTSQAVRHFTTLEMLRTPRFYMMYLMFLLMATGGLLVTAHAEIGGAVAAKTSQAVRHFTTLEMLRTPRFYMMYLMFLLMATGGLLVTANA